MGAGTSSASERCTSQDTGSLKFFSDCALTYVNPIFRLVGVHRALPSYSAPSLRLVLCVCPRRRIRCPERINKGMFGAFRRHDLGRGGCKVGKLSRQKRPFPCISSAPGAYRFRSLSDSKRLLSRYSKLVAGAGFEPATFRL